jgi:hypothetical protein
VRTLSSANISIHRPAAVPDDRGGRHELKFGSVITDALRLRVLELFFNAIWNRKG